MLTAPTETIVTRRFSTNDLPDRDRIAFVRDVWGRAQRHVDITPLGDGPYRSEGAVWQLPGLHIACRTSSPVRTERKTGHLADGAADMLVLLRAGSATASQLGREVAMQAGDAVLISSADTGVTTMPTESEIVVLPAPRSMLAPLVRDVEDAFMRPMRHSAALRLLAGYVSQLEDGALLSDATPGAADLQRTIASHIRDLMALVIGAAHDTAEAARTGGVRAARLATIRADILENLAQVRLSAKLMAERHGLSERYIHALFEDSGVTFSAFVTDERLKWALAMLRDPTCRDKRISDIAFEVGFGDLSHFNRAFRRRYGDTPRSLRRGGAEPTPHPGWEAGATGTA